MINPYDSCIWNKMIDSVQPALQLFIDDLHILYLNGNIINNLKCYLNEKFKTKFVKWSVCKGKVHNYLGINIDYMNNNYVNFTLYDFKENVLKEVMKVTKGLSPWPVSSKLFEVDDKLTPLNDSDANIFIEWQHNFCLYVKR